MKKLKILALATLLTTTGCSIIKQEQSLKSGEIIIVYYEQYNYLSINTVTYTFSIDPVYSLTTFNDNVTVKSPQVVYKFGEPDSIDIGVKTDTHKEFYSFDTGRIKISKPL